MMDIRNNGFTRRGRNGSTKALSGVQLKFMVDKYIPVLQSRKIHWRGVAGEYAAFIRHPSHISDFKSFGCNFWDPWADSEGNLIIDYGNLWRNYEGTNQMEEALRLLREDPQSRRILIDGWRPSTLSSLSLPCCHYTYQFVHHHGLLNLIWTQRSGDWMVGIPSDAISATIMLNHFASLANMKPFEVTMNIGDAHIYEEHTMGSVQLYNSYNNLGYTPYGVPYKFKKQKELYDFMPEDITLSKYDPQLKIGFKVIK